MQSSLAYRDTSYISLGERRGKSDLARFSLDLSWARAVSDSARSRAYPSPPMSGSPPLPPRRNPDSSDRGHGSYGSSGQDIYPGTQTPQSDISEPRGPPMRAYQQDFHPPMTYSPYRMEDMQQTPSIPYQQRVPPIVPQLMQQQQQPAYRQQPPAPFSTPDRPPTGGTPDYSASPKAQRKTKGHVASACVPCKRAHLRCDAQRPCSRCLANGKEDACVDVQHKKRGRPRLRDEREQRYESLGPGYPHPQHDGSMRRPLSLYSPESSAPPGYGDPLHRSSSYRVLKSQGPRAPRYPEHAQPLDPSLFGGPMPPGQRMLPSQEPLCAYLTMDMEIAKVTRSFGDTVGLQTLVSRRLQDIVTNNDREKVARLQRVLEEERREREPTYLPPILLKFEEGRIIQSVGFGQDEIGQLQLGHQEVITFVSEGRQRTFQARFGLAKKESTYFIAAVFQIPATPQPFHQPSPLSYGRDNYSREPQYGYQQPQHSFTPNQGSAFVSNPTYGDPRGDSMNYRTPVPLAANIPMSASMPSYSQPPQTRPDYSSQTQNPYQTPRSELPQGQSQRQHDLQLPPIRDQRSEAPSADFGRRRDDRRVDIGGLLEQPHASGGR